MPNPKPDSQLAKVRFHYPVFANPSGNNSPLAPRTLVLLIPPTFTFSIPSFLHLRPYTLFCDLGKLCSHEATQPSARHHLALNIVEVTSPGGTYVLFSFATVCV